MFLFRFRVPSRNGSRGCTAAVSLSLFASPFVFSPSRFLFFLAVTDSRFCSGRLHHHPSSSAVPPCAPSWTRGVASPRLLLSSFLSSRLARLLPFPFVSQPHPGGSPPFPSSLPVHRLAAPLPCWTVPTRFSLSLTLLCSISSVRFLHPPPPSLRPWSEALRCCTPIGPRASGR